MDRADVGADGRFQFTFEEGVDAVALPHFDCGPGELCGFDMQFGLGDFPAESAEDRELARYGIELTETFEDFNGGQQEFTQEWSMPDLMDGGFGSIQRGGESPNGGSWSFKFRPTFDIDLSEGSIDLTGFKFRGEIRF